MAAIILLNFGAALYMYFEQEDESTTGIVEADAQLAASLGLGQAAEDARKEFAEVAKHLRSLKGVARDSGLQATAVLEREYGFGDPKKTVAQLSEGADATQAQVNRIWRATYGGERLNAKDAKAARDLLWDVSTLRSLAYVHLLEATHKQAEAKSARAELKAAARAEVLRLAGFLLLYLAVAAVGIFGLLWYALRTGHTPAPGLPQHWTIGTGDALGEAYMVSGLLGLLVVGLAGAGLQSYLEQASVEVSLFAESALGLVIFVPSFAYLGVLAGRSLFSLRDIGWHLGDLRRNVLWGLGGLFAAAAAAGLGFLLGLVLLRNLPQGSNPVGELAISAAGPWQWVGLLLAGSVVAPLAEETFFRGVLFMGLWRRLNSFWLAAVISSAAFALVHPQLFAGFGAVMGMGIVSCLLLRERRSLVPSIVMHATYNGALLVGAMLGF